MNTVINFPARQIEFGFINEHRVKKPKTAAEYLAIAKQFLETEDYRELLCAIMDVQFYSETEGQIQKIVDAYFSFGEKN